MWVLINKELPMSICSIHFCREIRKISLHYVFKKMPYLKWWLWSTCMHFTKYVNIKLAKFSQHIIAVTLRKHAYSNILKISPPKTESFQIKILIFFIFLHKTDCEYSLELPHRGSSNEYPQSMFLSRNKKNNVYPCKPQFYYIKVGFQGVKIIQVHFRDGTLLFFIFHQNI